MPHQKLLWTEVLPHLRRGLPAGVRLSLAFLLMAHLSLEHAWAANSLKAFPSAVGQGAVSVGGRGGDVYHVTNLLDYRSQADEKEIPGSLRHAIRSADGPRTIVFDVAGAIGLVSDLRVLQGHLTIAGQTSPGGITLWGYPVDISRGSDVIVRHLRIRTGDFNAIGVKSKPGRGKMDLNGDSANGLQVGGGARRLILDHLSVSWGMDETLSLTKCRGVTVQHCLISESLNDSYHPKGLHGYGSLIRGSLTAEEQTASTGGFTLYGNLWAHHRARNPSVAGQQRLHRGQSEAKRKRADVNLINNVIYDWGIRPTHRSTSGMIRVNLIGNYYVNGPENDTRAIFYCNNPGETHLYHDGNVHDWNQDAVVDGELVGDATDVQREFRGLEQIDSLADRSTGKPFPFIANVSDSVVSAEEAYKQVVDSVGAFLARDVIDKRTIDSLVNRTGGLIDSQEIFRQPNGQLAGIDDLPTVSREAGFDTDQDGMPNDFETQHGLNSQNPQDRNDTNLSELGYTNLEVYLNSLVQ